MVSGRSRFQLLEHLPDVVSSVPSQEDVVTLELPGSTLSRGGRSTGQTSSASFVGKSVLLIQKMATKAKDQAVTIFISSTLLKMEVDGAKFTTKLLDGSFPDCRRVIPGSMPTKVALSSSDLLKGVQLASIPANENTGRAPIGPCV